MSRTIDEKVVEMKFDNSDFEKGVSQSMSTIDKLKNALNFSDAESSFAPLESALEGAGKKFSAFETMAVGALLNIGGKIEDFVEKQVKSLTIEPITKGFDKYAKKTSSVQMIMNATEKEIEEVSDQLERLNWYTDETSYDFTEMVASIGKFTSAGIELDSAVTAMEGIANWAGVSGATKQEANRAMYNISQALAGGYMRLQDWKSIENANMATKEFKETVIQMAIEMGTLEEAVDDTGKAIYGFITDSGGFEEVNFQTMAGTLTKGKWLTNDVLNATLAIYGAFTDELSKVYDDMNETVDITTSEIIGYVNQYIDGTIDWSEATEATGKSAEELETILASLGREEYALGRKSFAAAQEAKTFQEAIDATKDAVSTGWMNTFEILFGNYDEAKVLWTDLANELWDIFAGPISDMNEMLTEWADPEGFGGRELLIESIKNIYRGIRSLVDPIAEAWEKIFPSLDAEGLFKLTEKFNAFTESLILSEDHMYDIRILFESIFGVIKLVKDGVGELIDAFAGGLKRNKKGFFEGIWDSIHNASVKLDEFRDGVQKVRDRIDNFKAKITTEEDINRLKEAEPVLYGIVNIFEKLKSSAAIIGGFAGRAINLKNIFSEYKEAGEGFAGVTKVISDRWTDALGIVQRLVQEWTGINIGSVTTPIIEAIEYIQSKIEEIQKSGVLVEIKGKISDIVTEFEKNFGKISSWFEPLVDAGRSIWTDFVDGIKMLVGTDTSGTAGFFDSIKNGLDSIKEFIATNPELKSTIETFKDVIKIFADFLADFLSLSGTIQTYRDAGGGISGVLAVINDKIEAILHLISDIISRVTGFETSDVVDGIMFAIRAVEEGLAHIANFIAKLFGWDDNPFAKFLGSSSGAFDTLLEQLKAFGKGDSSVGGVFDKIGDTFSNLWKTIKVSLPGLSEAFATITDIFKGVIDALKELTISDIIDISKIIALIYIGKQLGDLFGELSDTLIVFQKKLKAEAIMDIAIAIIAVAGAAYLISKIDEDKILGVIGVLVAGMAGLVGVLIASQFADFRALLTLPLILLSAAASMIILAKAVGVITDTVGIFSGIDMKDLAKGLGGVTVAIVELLAALAIASKITGGSLSIGKTFTAVAVSLIVLFAAVELFRAIDWGTLIDSLLKIVTAIASVGLALGVISLLDVVLSKLSKRSSATNFAKAMKDVAKGMLLIAVAVAAVNLISFKDYFEGLLKIVIGIAAIAGVAGLLSPLSKALDTFSESLYKLGKGLAYIAIFVGIFGLIGVLFGDLADQLIDKGVDLIAKVLRKIADKTYDIAESLVKIVLGIIEAVAEHANELVAAIMKIVVAIFQEVGKSLKTVDPAPFLKGAEFIAGIVAAMFGIKKLGGIGFGAFAKTAGAILGAVLIMTEIIVAMGAIGSLIELAKDELGWDILDSIERLGKVLDAMAELMFGKVGLMILALAGVLILVDKLNIKGSMNGLGGVLTAIMKITVILAVIVFAAGVLGEAVTALDEGLSWINEKTGWDKDLIETINYLGDVLEAIADVIGGTVGHVIGSLVGGISGSAMEEMMDGFAKGIVSISTAVNDIPDDALSKATLAASMLTTLMAVTPKEGGIIQWITGKESTGIKNLGEALPSLGTALTDFSTNISTFDNGAVDKAEAGATVISKLSEATPNEGGLWQYITGSNTLGLTGISMNLPLIGAALSAFSAKVSSFDTSSTDKAEAGATVISKLSEATPNEGGLLQLLMGSNTIGFAALSISLPLLAGALTGFSEKISNFDSTIVENAEKAMEIVMSLSKTTLATGGLWDILVGSNAAGILMLGVTLPVLGNALTGFSNNISEFDPETAEKAGPAAETILALSKDVPKGGGLLQFFMGNAGSGMMNISKSLPALGAGLSGFSTAMTNFDPSVASKVEACSTIIKGLSEATPNEFGLWQILTGSNSAGLTAMGINLPLLGKALQSYSESVSGIDEGSIKKSESGVSILKSLSEIPNEGGLIQKIFGSNALGITLMTGNLVIFGAGLAAYSAEVSGFNSVAVENTKGAIDIVKGLSDVTPNEAGFLQSVIGSNATGIALMSANLPLFGTGIKKYSVNMNGFLPKAVESTKSAVTIVSDLTTAIPSNGGLWGHIFGDTYGGMKNIADNLPSFGTAIHDYAVNISGMPTNVVYNTGLILTAINNIDAAVDKASSMKQFGESIGDYYTKIKRVDPLKMEQVADVVSRTWNLMFNVAKGTVGVDYMQQYNNLGELSMEGYAKGVITGSQKVMDATSSVMNSGIDTARRTLEVQSPSRVFMRIGEYVSEGLAIGITDGIGMVVESTAEMANAMTDEAKDILGIHSPSDVWYWIGQMVEKGFSGGLFDGKTDILNTIHGVMDSILNGASFDEVKKLFENSGIDTASLFGEGFYDTMKEKWDLGSMMEGADITGSMDEMKKEYESAMKDVTGSVDIENPMAEMQNEYTDFDWMNSIYDNNGEGAQEFVNTYMGNAGAGGADAYVDSSISTLQDAAPKYKEAGMELSTETSEGMVTAAPEGAEKLTEAYQESLDNSGGLDIGATTTISLGQAKSALEVLDRYFDGLKASIHEIKNQMIEEAEEGADAYVESTTAGVRVAEEKTEEARDAVSEATIDGAEGVLDVVKEKAENTEIEGPTLTLVVNADQAKDELEKTIKGLERKGIAVSVVSDPNDIPEDGNVMYYKMTEDERRELEQKRAAGLTDSASKTTAEITQDEVQNAWTGHSLRIASQLEQVDIYSRQLGSTMETVVEKLDEIKESNANTNVYLDGNIMVGAMANRMDRAIGTKATLAGRRV